MHLLHADEKRGSALIKRTRVRATMSKVGERALGPTVLVVDDHEGFRLVARALLESHGFAVVGEAADGASALDAAVRLAPDLVLLDVQLPDMDGFEVAGQLATRSLASPTVVLISTRQGASYRRRLAESPALGFISKSDLTGPALMALLIGHDGPGRVREGGT